MPFELLSSKNTYHGRAFSVRRDEIRLPDGALARLDIVEHVGAVTILPLDDQGQVWFVRQYRHAAGIELLELPAGTLEPGEDPQVCAHREIREETGMAAGRLQKIGEFFLAPGYSTEYMHVYLAQDLLHDPLPGDQDEFLSVERYPLAQVYAMLRNGEIRDAKTIAALSLAQPLIDLD
ncbi:MAG: NUDIX hydrolase [Anaerolineales bacterium]|nr:NUDIX hydrolase [Anaerolineales bacterium]